MQTSHSVGYQPSTTEDNTTSSVPQIQERFKKRYDSPSSTNHRQIPSIRVVYFRPQQASNTIGSALPLIRTPELVVSARAGNALALEPLSPTPM